MFVFTESEDVFCLSPHHKSAAQIPPLLIYQKRFSRCSCDNAGNLNYKVANIPFFLLMQILGNVETDIAVKCKKQHEELSSFCHRHTVMVCSSDINAPRIDLLGFE